MTCSEPSRSTAYSNDIRWRIVWQREALGLSYRVIAENLNIDRSTSTVHRIVRLFQVTATLASDHTL